MNNLMVPFESVSKSRNMLSISAASIPHSDKADMNSSSSSPPLPVSSECGKFTQTQLGTTANVHRHDSRGGERTKG